MSDDGQGTRRADVRLPFVPADDNEVLPEPVHDRVEDETPANDEAKPLGKIGKSQPQPAANGMNGNGSGNGSDTGTDIGTGTHKLEAPDPGRLAPPEEAYRKFCRDVLLPAPLKGSEILTAVHQARDATFSAAHAPLRAVIAQTSKLWNKGKDPIHFVFLPGNWIGNETQHEKVRTCIKEWEKYASFHFEEVQPNSDWKTRLGTEVIRVTFYDLPSGGDAGSWSTIGTDTHTVPLDRPTMNFGWVKGDTSSISAEEKAVIWHEVSPCHIGHFGHAVGCLHEHQSMSGGGVPLKNVQEAIKYFHTYNNWSDAQIMQQVVNTYNLTDVSSFSQVDRTSIMHYPIPGSVSGLPYDIPYQYTLSDMDKAYMRIMYPANDPNSGTQQVLQAALATAGIVKGDPQVANQILSLANKADAHGVVDPSQIRQIFSDWCRKTIPVSVISGGTSAPSGVPAVPATGGTPATNGHALVPSKLSAPVPDLPSGPILRAGPGAPLLRADPSPGNTKDGPSERFKAGLLGAVYDALNNAFGPQGAQFLSLQFPTRFLGKDDFTFDLDGIYSNFIKPVTVAEAEARLVDAMYDPSPIVGGPNGKTLSTVYSQAINNLVPRYEPEDRPAREQRERMRAWLLTEVGDQNPFYKLEVNTSTGGQVGGSGLSEAANKALLASNAVTMRKMTRMEFANQLTQDYLDAQTAWEMEREGYIHKAISTRDQNELESVTRTLVHTMAAQQNKLSMKYADAVVRGYSHVVREALGQLDVSTTAETLQDAKDSFRATSLSSLYSASKVLPVIMTPVDWAVGLDTNFTPEDLADSPDAVIMMIEAKASKLDAYKAQLALLQGAVDGDPVALKAAVDAAAQNLDQVESALNSKYMDSTIELAKVIINVSTGGAAFAAAKVAEMTTQLESSVKKLDPAGTVEDIGKQITAVGDAQRAVQQATSVYASKSAALARAKATDTRTEQTSIQRNIDALTADLTDLRARLSAATASANKLKELNDANNGAVDVKTLAAAGTNPTSGGSRWQTIYVTRSMEYKADSTDTTSDFSRTSWSCNFWIASGGGSNEKSEATSKTTNEGNTLDIDISMKVTLVTVDRSGWFQPQVLENSAAFMQNNSNYKFATYPAGSEKLNPTDMARKIREELVPPSFPADCPLPCYPTGMILCKDVTIKVSNMQMSSEADQRHFLEKSESSGGFLCFHYNRSSEHQEDSSHATFNFAKDGMIVKIPGPQVLGYIQQMVPSDASIKFDPTKSLANEFYLPPPATPELARNTDKSAGGDVAGGHGGALKSSNPQDPAPEFSFKVGRTTMTPKAEKQDEDGGQQAKKPSGLLKAKPVVDGASTDSAREPPLVGMNPDPVAHGGNISDVFKHIVDQLETNDDTLRDAVKKWLQSPSLGLAA